MTSSIVLSLQIIYRSANCSSALYFTVVTIRHVPHSYSQTETCANSLNTRHKSILFNHGRHIRRNNFRINTLAVLSQCYHQITINFGFLAKNQTSSLEKIDELNIMSMSIAPVYNGYCPDRFSKKAT